MSDDIYSDIGRRLRQKRIEAGLTQSAVCGDMITRNMLSRIENGAARPSLETLLYLAERLNTSASYLLCRDSAEEAQYNKTVTVTDLRKFIGEGRFESAAAMDAPETDDEVLFAKALSEGHCALTALNTLNLVTAKKHIDCALDSTAGSVYLRDELTAELHLLEKLCKSLTGERLPQPGDIAAVPTVIMDATMRTYLLMLSLYEHTGDAPDADGMLPEGTSFYMHLAAKKAAKNGRYEKALDILHDITNNSSEAIVKFFALKDTELCCCETGQYKEAYEISKRRETVLNDSI